MTSVVLSGLTAAGKTTHARRLARELGWKTLHATEVLMQLIEPDANFADDAWFTRLAEIEAMRDNQTVDDLVDGTILAQVNTSTPIVVDSWTLPWYGPKDLVNVWIGSDRLSRAWKCQVSRLPHVDFSTAQCAELIDQKDQASRERFLARQNFDLFSDRSPFDFVLDNSHLINEPTRSSSDRGIEIFGQVVSACARLVLMEDVSGFTSIFESSEPVFRSSFVMIGQRPRGLLGRRCSRYLSYLPTRVL